MPDGHQLDFAEQAWGIPFSPEEFINVAISRDHPKAFSNLLPGFLEEAVRANFIGDSSSLLGLRADWFTNWTARAKQLAVQELALKQELPEYMQKMLQPKRMLL